MKVTNRTRRVRKVRRQRRDMIRLRWEYVGENGGRLWELYRDCRYDHRIVDAIVAEDGMGFWVKVERELQ
jgi:hypothetical protein